MNKGIFIGIDPGKQGAVVAQDGITGKFKITVMPLIGKEVDRVALNEIFNSYRSTTRPVHVVLEDVHSIFGAGAKSNWSFGYTCGLTEMSVVANGLSMTLIQPKVWQAEMWQGIPKQYKADGKKIDTKAMSLMAAKRLFPKVNLIENERCRVEHDGIVDALLISEYCKRKFFK